MTRRQERTIELISRVTPEQRRRIEAVMRGVLSGELPGGQKSFPEHEGRPGQVGGSLPRGEHGEGKPKPETGDGKKTEYVANEKIAKYLSSTFVNFHNQASDEYKNAFKQVGARMWKGDNAHRLGPEHEEYIYKSMNGMKLSSIKEIYIISRPLTVLDAYPNVTSIQRRWLEKKVDQIYKNYSMKWKVVLNKLIPKDYQKIAIFEERSFPDHEGRPGEVGGSLPRGEGSVDDLDDKERALINEWEEDLNFLTNIRDINAGGAGDVSKEEYDDFMKAVNKLPNYTGVAYRGVAEEGMGRMQLLNKYARGNTIEIKSISSFSKSVATASYFASSKLNPETAEIVDIPKGVSVILKLDVIGKDVANVASIPEQKEVLVGKSKYRIVSSVPSSLVVEGRRRHFLLVKGIKI